MAEPQLSDVEALRADHNVSAFDCGKPELTEWLRRFALTNQQAESARVYVVHRGGRIVGYYALVSSAVSRSNAPVRVGQGLANHPVPVVLLARLAVDAGEQRQGLGAALLKDAFLRVVRAADEIGVRALLVHAQDEEARAFYEHFDFEPSPTDPLHLFLLLKDLRHAID